MECIDALMKSLFLNYLHIFIVNAKGQESLDVLINGLANF